MNDAIAREYLEKEHKKLTISLERALNRNGITQTEIDNLQRKIDINLYLQTKCK